jgi:hypothetical protein
MKKSHWITLILVVLLVGVYFIAKNRQPVEKEVRFFKADSAAVAKLVLVTPEDTVVVEKKGTVWQLTYPLVWDVNETQLKTFFSQVLAIKTSRTPMSEDPNLQKLYKVDEANAVQVKIYNKSGNLLDHVYIGNGANTTFDYGRKQGEKPIYQFRDNITNIVKPDIYQWRSPNITNLKRALIDRIEVSYTKNAYILSMVGDSIRYSDKQESFMIPIYNKAQNKIINALENLMTWQFVDKDTEQYRTAFANPDCRITVFLKNKTTKTLSLLRLNSAASESVPNGKTNEVLILMMIDNKITPIYQMTGDFINRFTRASAHFKSEYD